MKKRKPNLDELLSSNKKELLAVVYEQRVEIADLKQLLWQLKREPIFKRRKDAMSLDVYLCQVGIQGLPQGEAILLREEGQLKELTRAEWKERYPFREPVVVYMPENDNYVYSANITHNLNKMAGEVGEGYYQALWRPGELGYTCAKQLIDDLGACLVLLKAHPEHFEKFNPKNGWGTYETLVEFVEKYLEACKQYPDAEIRVSR